MRVTIRNDEDEGDLIVWTEGREQVYVLHPSWDLQIVFEGVLRCERVIEHVETGEDVT